MERCTGWSAAIVAAMAAHRRLRPGAGGVEEMVPAADYVAEVRHRGLAVAERIQFLAPAEGRVGNHQGRGFDDNT
jgi:hypothetical protein